MVRIRMRGEERPGVTLASLIGAFLLLPLLGFKSRKLRRRLLSLAALILAAALASVAMTGCGSSGPTTPAGTYSIQVTATSGSLTQAATFSLTFE